MRIIKLFRLLLAFFSPKTEPVIQTVNEFINKFMNVTNLFMLSCPRLLEQEKGAATTTPCLSQVPV